MRNTVWFNLPNWQSTQKLKSFIDSIAILSSLQITWNTLLQGWPNLLCNIKALTSLATNPKFET